MQKDECEEQRERNRHRHNHCCAEAHQEENQHDQHQNHAAHKVRFHGVRGEPHQIAAIVEGTHLDIRRQDAFIDLLCFLLHAFQHVLGLLAAQHQDDALDGVVSLVESEFAQPRRMPDGHVADVAHTHRHAILRFPTMTLAISA